MRGNLQFSKQKGFGRFEEDFNEISMIKDSTNVETNQNGEESFNFDLFKNIIDNP